MMTLFEEIAVIFRQVFDDEKIQILPSTTSNDIDGWDSLSHLNLILAIEIHFKIEFSQRELLRFRNVGDLIASIERKI